MSGEAAPARSVTLPFIIFTAIWGSTWIIIRGQLGTVPPQWSISYRFLIAGIVMAIVALRKGESLRLGARGMTAAGILGLLQFVVNFNAVYLAENRITSGLVATVFALLVIPNTLLGWAFLGQKPTLRFVWSSAVAVVGIALLFVHEIEAHPARTGAVLSGIALTVAGLLGASCANVFQARESVRRYPLFALLAWAMILGAAADAMLAMAFTGPPAFDARPGYWLGLLYLALFASALAFSLYLPVVRRIGPGKAAYSSVIVPIIAMGFSTWLEHYRWTPLAVAGALLAIGGMAAALSRSPSSVQSPDAA